MCIIVDEANDSLKSMLSTVEASPLRRPPTTPETPFASRSNMQLSEVAGGEVAIELE